MEFYDFPYIGKFIIPTDELRFFRGVGIPPTSYLIYVQAVFEDSNDLMVTLVLFQRQLTRHSGPCMSPMWYCWRVGSPISGHDVNPGLLNPKRLFNWEGTIKKYQMK